jgi:hypothetical protein
MIFFERSGGAISDGAVASSKVFDVHLDFAYSSDYSSFHRGHVISNKNYNNSHVLSFDITSPKIVIFQLFPLYFLHFLLANQKSASLASATNQVSHSVGVCDMYWPIKYKAIFVWIFLNASIAVWAARSTPN